LYFHVYLCWYVVSLVCFTVYFYVPCALVVRWTYDQAGWQNCDVDTWFLWHEPYFWTFILFPFYEYYDELVWCVVQMLWWEDYKRILLFVSMLDGKNKDWFLAWLLLWLKIYHAQDFDGGYYYTYDMVSLFLFTLVVTKVCWMQEG